MTATQDADDRHAGGRLVEAVSYSIPGACAASGIGRTAMFNLLRDGLIKAKRKDGRRYILRVELERYMNSLEDAA